MVTADELRTHMRRRRIVRFERPFERGYMHGYVAGVGSKLLLLSCIDDGVRFDGFFVVRIRDLRNFAVDPRSAFLEAALRKRGLERPRAPRLDLSDFGAVLRQLGRLVPLVAIHRERIDPDVCQIGAVVDVQPHRVVLREIDPDGEYCCDDDSYALREITRVDFGCSYEDALWLVGGDPPDRDPRRSGERVG